MNRDLKDIRNLSFMTIEEKQEFYNNVHNKIEELIDDYYDKNECALSESIREVNEDFHPLIREIKERMKSIEETLAAQAIGIQNVYDEFKKVSTRRKA